MRQFVVRRDIGSTWATATIRAPQVFRTFPVVHESVVRDGLMGQTSGSDVSHTAVELEDWLKESYSTSYRTAYVLVGNPADAQDAVQEAFLRVWRFRDSLKNQADYRPWLYRVLVNACYSHMRREIRHRDRRASADALDEALTPDRTTRFDARSDVARAVSNLSVDLRTVVLLRYFAELSEREIATAIDRPVGTVKSRLNEARRRLSQDPFLHDDDATFTIDKEVASDHE